MDVEKVTNGFTVGALEPKKWLKRPDAPVGVPKIAPKANVFCYLYNHRYGGVMQKCLPPREIVPHFADQAAGYPILGPRVGYSCLKALKVSLEQDEIGL